jgi:pullulanase
MEQSINQNVLYGGYIEGRHSIKIFLNELPQQKLSINDFIIKDSDNNLIDIDRLEFLENPREIICNIKPEIDIKKEYYVTYLTNIKRLVFNNIYLDEKYFDIDAELGTICNKDFTIFRLFAPRAKSVKIRIYQNPVRTENEQFEEQLLSEKKGGVWEIKINGDLHRKYYTYLLESVGQDCNPNLEVIDPYSKLVTRGDGINVIRKNKEQPFDQTLGRAMIIDFSRTSKTMGLISNEKKVEQSIIWEVHVRDLTRDINSGVPDIIKGTYLGASYRESEYKELKTGIDHIIELGVNTVHLLPVNEFVIGNETDFKHKYITYKDHGKWPEQRYYDWGYGPIYYFSPEGYYSTKTDDPSRVNEFKKMVSEFHKNGIKVVLDVVFNHTFEGSREHPNIYSFRGIDTDHYYRSMPDGTFYDGISCQNEVKTENPMVSKLLLDCLTFWVKEYKIDGFRFDWMSAYDPENMVKMIKSLKEINPDILIYGELWTLRGLSYTGKNNGTYLDRQHIGLFEKDYNLPPGSIAGFNDYFRDAVKGSGFMREYAGGYIQNVIDETYYPNNAFGHKPYELVKKVISGMINYESKDNNPNEWAGIESPLSSINYIDCHDGYTLFDKIIITEYCKDSEKKRNSPKYKLPISADNKNVVDFNDSTQFNEPDSEQKIIKMNNLGAAILLTSQGIPFLHAGQELLRQKINYVNIESSGQKYYIFDDNSNTSSDETNAIKWENKRKYYEVFNYYKGLIKLRKEHPSFYRTSKESVLDGLTFHDNWLPTNGIRCIAYSLTDHNNKIKSEEWKEIVVLMNPYNENKIFNIPKGNWNVVVAGSKAGTETLYKITEGKIEVESISMVVMYKEVK